MPSRALLERERPLMRARRVACTRRELTDEIDRRTHADPTAETHQERGVVLIGKVNEVGVADPDWFDIDGAMVAKLPRQGDADRRRMVVAEVVHALDRHQDAEAHRIAAPLVQHVVLTEEFDRLVAARAEQPRLEPAHQAEAILEPDDCAVVEPEQIVGDVAKVALAERPGKPVRHPERALEPRQSERCRQIDEREVRLRRVRIPVRIISRRRRRRVLRPRRPRKQREQEEQYGQSRTAHGVLLPALRTISMPLMSSWPLPQYSEQRIGKLPSVVAVKSIVTGSPPRGTSFLIFSFLISRPWTPSADRTTSCRRSPTVAVTSDGSNANRRAVISTTRGSVVCADGPRSTMADAATAKPDSATSVRTCLRTVDMGRHHSSTRFEQG